jgi:hypothetical protein
MLVRDKHSRSLDPICKLCKKMKCCDYAPWWVKQYLSKVVAKTDRPLIILQIVQKFEQ